LLGFLLAAAPASQPASQIRTWFDQLSDRDAKVRDKAMENLMGLDAGDLPTLQSVVAAARPLRPSQKIALREIVTQVYVASLPYAADPTGAPFLGLSWARSDIYDNSQGGLIVAHRVVGFSAYRMLRDGDVITSIEEKPGEKIDNESFSLAIQSFRPGQTITLHVLRDGNPQRIAVQLRPRPANVNVVQLEYWISEHESAADHFWDDHFADLVGDDVS
jgi:hypothetical protein